METIRIRDNQIMQPFSSFSNIKKLNNNTFSLLKSAVGLNKKMTSSNLNKQPGSMGVPKFKIFLLIRTSTNLNK